jgi:hypothetical protein
VLVALVLLAGCDRQELIVAGDAGAAFDATVDPGVDAAVEPAGGSECDQQDDCTACFTCVQGPHQACVDLAIACSESSECAALVNCLNACAPTDEGCARGCGGAHSSATSMLVAFYRCAYCDACPADCRADHDWCVDPPF